MKKIKHFDFKIFSCVFLVLLFSCSSPENDREVTDDDDVEIPIDENPNDYIPIGELIPIPNLDVNSTGYGLFLKTSNEAIYFEVQKVIGEKVEYWIDRMQNGAIPTWSFSEQHEQFHFWEPSKELNEVPDEFAIFFRSLEHYGFVSKNSGTTPALLENDITYENELAYFNEIIIDNSPMAYTWGFNGNTVKIKRNNDSEKFDEICTLPRNIDFVEADPYDAVVWAAAGDNIYKITASGAYTQFDVSSFTDNADIINPIGKIRFQYDSLHKDVYFRYRNKVFRLVNGTSGSLFYTIEQFPNSNLAGDFAIDHSYMYASDGTKKDLYLLTESKLFSLAPPVTNDQKIMNDYILAAGALNAGPIEVSKDPNDGYIYAVVGKHVLRVKK